MKTKILCGLVLFAAACSGTQGKGDVGGNSDTLALKKAAAEAAGPGKPVASDDVCVKQAWYGDGVCDTFCAQNDADCIPDGTGTVCADFIEGPDGTCSRSKDDPCAFQDSDCGGLPPSPGGCGDGIVCATISEAGDGVCKRPASDPCRTQDPDCVPSDAPGDNDPGPGDGNGSEPGTVCPAIIETANGKCERPFYDPCRSIDPDCAVACAAYVEQSDGECKRDPYDPCIAQDPDCKVK